MKNTLIICIICILALYFCVTIAEAIDDNLHNKTEAKTKWRIVPVIIFGEIIFWALPIKYNKDLGVIISTVLSKIMCFFISASILSIIIILTYFEYNDTLIQNMLANIAITSMYIISISIAIIVAYLFIYLNSLKFKNQRK